jgi:hypothetical protein
VNVFEIARKNGVNMEEMCFLIEAYIREKTGRVILCRPLATEKVPFMVAFRVASNYYYYRDATNFDTPGTD